MTARGTSTQREATAPDQTDGILRCVHCGVRARWVDGQPVNAEDHPVPSLCSTRPRRAHGPFVPDPDTPNPDRTTSL